MENNILKVQNQVALTSQVTSGPIVSIAGNSEKVPLKCGMTSFYSLQQV